MSERNKHNDQEGLTAGKISQINYENIFNVYDTGDFYYYNLIKTIIVPEEMDEENFFYYDVLVGDTWTNIAYNVYGDVRAWWLICIANNIFDPTSFPKIGQKLKLFTRVVAQQILATINREDAL